MCELRRNIILLTVQCAHYVCGAGRTLFIIVQCVEVLCIYCHLKNFWSICWVGVPNSISKRVKFFIPFFVVVVVDRKQFILVCHDWGSIIGSAFVERHDDMVQKYILMGAPPRRVFKKLLRTSLDQFKRSWYIFFFQMPILPEMALTCDDLVAFDKMLGRRHNEEMTDEYLEAYKYVFSKPG